ncbi:MAG: DNA primase, partial [Bdellovibrionota bacterium]
MKGKFTPEFRQAIKDKVNLVDVVREHVILRKTGGNYMGKCPFHSDGSPSFSVSETKQLYHCFGCGKSGDLFAFVMELQGISFQDAVEELAERGGVPLPKGMAEESDDPATAKLRAESREKLKLTYKLNRFVASFYRHSLPKTPHAAKYFEDRGVSGEIAEQFYVGAAPASWDALARHLVAAKAPLPIAQELGLIHPSQKTTRAAAGGPGFFDAFRNRAIFPILDSRGKVVGFGGRTLELPPGAPDTGGEGAKYINSSGSFLFNKSKALYGLFQAQKHIREKREVILVEGYFDVIGLHKAGFTHAVATCGTALGPEHLKILRRFEAKIIVLFDGDEAGREATRKSMETGLEQGMVLYGAKLPADKDPDEIVLDAKGEVRAQ